MRLKSEATLNQLLAETIIRLVMKSDGVGEDEIRRLIADAAAKRRSSSAV